MSKKNTDTGIESTEVRGAVKWFLLLAFICTIATVPLGQWIVDLSAAAPAGEKLSLLPKAFATFSYEETASDLDGLRMKHSGIGYGLTATQLLNDKTVENTKKFESTMEEQSWLLSALGPKVEKVLIGALGSGSRDVYCGKDGWLFFRPTLEYLTGGPFLDPEVMKRRVGVQPDPVRAIVDFKDQLARRGIELVVVPSPAKATIYPERFSSRYTTVSQPLQNPSYPELLRRLESRGVRVFDPAPLLLQAKGEQELFLKTDTHWTPAGSELVAQHLATYLVKNRLIPEVKPTTYTRVATFAEGKGDLAAMLKTASDYPKQRVELKQVRQQDGAAWPPSRDADILLLGDSYANIFSLDGMGWGTGSGLVEQLSFHLRRPVDSILINDKGSFSTRQQLGNELRRGQDRLAGKKVVVYEFAARELALGDWKIVNLSLGRGTGTATSVEGVQAVETAKAAPDGLEVEGVIEEISRPPRPGSTAYKDAVIAMHLKQVTSSGKPFAMSQIVVFCWGMRDDKATAAARYKKGERITLKLRPWSQVEHRYGGYQRIELQNPDTVLMDIYWIAQPEDRQAAPVKVASNETKASTATDIADTGASSTGKVPGEEMASPKLSNKEAKELFQKKVLEIHAQLNEKQARVHQGTDDWLFSKLELDHLVKGPFWGDAAQKVSAATKPDNRDPLPAILDFKQQLDSAGIDLIVLPVPAKAHVYPDKLVDGISQTHATPANRFDPVHQQFLALLQEAGIETVDVTELFLKARATDGKAVFLKNDTHWSPYGISLVAEALKRKISRRPWFEKLEKSKFTKSAAQLKMKGDLGDFPENVTITPVRRIEDGKETPVDTDRNSPILLVGDSHTLIFHSGGDMHAEGAGLLELLSYELGVNLDLVGVRGSGATPARVELLRRRDNLKGKNLVIWCFTVREYSESVSGWQKMSVIRQLK